MKSAARIYWYRYSPTINDFCRYSEDVYLETRTNDKGKRHLVVSKVANQDELKLKEKLKRKAEFVSTIVILILFAQCSC